MEVILKMQLANKVAIVTGGSRGIGRQISKLFAREGAKVVVTARSEREGEIPGTIHQTVREIRAAGGEAIAVPCDVAREDDIESLVKQALGRYGQIDLLVNNAATRLDTRLVDTDRSDLERIFRVNVFGPFSLWKQVLPPMIERRQGNIINIISGNVISGGATTEAATPRAPYRASKVTLTFLSVDLALEVRDYGIVVNAFNPGPVETEGAVAIRLQRGSRYGPRSSGAPKSDPPEVCDDPVLYLATQTVDTFTGQVVHRKEFGKTWGFGVSAREH